MAYVLLAGALCSLVFFVLPWGWVAHMESLTTDFRFKLRGINQSEPPVVVVGIADSSFNLEERAPALVAADAKLRALSQPWPWDRRVFASVVEKLHAAGARAIVFDIVFRAETDGDAAFAETLGRSDIPVVLAKHYSTESTMEGERSLTVLEPREPLAAAGHKVSLGFANLWPDADGIVREVPGCLSLSQLIGLPAAAGEAKEASLSAALALALGAPGAADEGLASFRGPEASVPTIPIENLFLADRWEGPVIGKGTLFKGKVVVVGPLSELRFKDYHATPFGRMSGAEVQANLIETCLNSSFIKRPPALLTRALVALAVAGAAALCWYSRRARLQVLMLGGLVFAWLALSQVLFVSAHFALPIVAPTGALLTTGAFGVGLRYMSEQHQRRRYRALLSSYVSEHVAEVIVRRPESLDVALRGERRPVTIIFTDVRGFTAMTEARPAGELVAQLNELLTAMVDCILVQEGTVQKFIGDAILAVWGDTHTAGEETDASRAVSAALAMEKALERLNAGWVGRADRPQLKMGIGIYQGVITVGNMGHPRRMEFGVLGEAVNMASRLESATKHLGVNMLAGDAVLRLASARHRFARITGLVVQGREQPIDTGRPVPTDEPEAVRWLDAYDAALAALRAGDLDKAAAAFGALTQEQEWQRGLAAFQLRRIGDLRASGEAPTAPLILGSK